MPYRLITKPEQSGKTFIMFQEMVKLLSNEKPNSKKNINLVMCDNNLMLVLQTIKRIKGIEILKDYLELSSSKRTDYNKYLEVIDGIINQNKRNILCCSNHIRMKDIGLIITSIYNLSKGDDYYFNIWIDESDKWLNSLDKYIKPLIAIFGNIKVNLVTATPERIIKKYGEVEILPLENSTLPEYHKWTDSIFKQYPNIYKTEEFVEWVLGENTEEIVKGSKWFIPGGAKKESHLFIKDLCEGYGMATLIINGEGFTLYLPDGECYSKDRNNMPDRLISQVYQEYFLERFPLAITGYFCISRGITISSQNFQISHAIMPASMQNKNEISQIAGRIKGNQKGWDNYQTPKVYCTHKFFETAKLIETKTINLAEKAHKFNWKYVDIDKFITCDKDFIYYQHNHQFKSYDEAARYLKTQENNLKPKGDTKEIIDLDKMIQKKKWILPLGGSEQGYLVSSSLYTKKTILKADIEFLTQDVLKENPIHKMISSPYDTKTRSFVILPVYNSKESKYDDVKFIVRHTKWV